jgi:hypothetical protein
MFEGMYYVLCTAGCLGGICRVSLVPGNQSTRVIGAGADVAYAEQFPSIAHVD